MTESTSLEILEVLQYCTLHCLVFTREELGAKSESEITNTQLKKYKIYPLCKETDTFKWEESEGTQVN